MPARESSEVLQLDSRENLMRRMPFAWNAAVFDQNRVQNIRSSECKSHLGQPAADRVPNCRYGQTYSLRLVTHITCLKTFAVV